MVTAGTALTYYVDGDVRESMLNSLETHTATVRSNALSRLQGTGLTVDECTITSNEGTVGRSWTYRATVRVRTSMAFGDLVDVTSIVKGAFWQATGIEPARVDTTAPAGGLGTGGGGPIPWGMIALAVIALAAALIVSDLT